jgi:hypothetical protein
MEEKITLAFDEDGKYLLEFSPPKFWADFASGYNSLSWKEMSDARVSVVAESYTYLVDMLVQARQFYLKAKGRR